MFPVTLLNEIAEMSQKYAHKIFSRKVDTVDRDGGKAKKQIFQQFDHSACNARHWAAKKSRSFTTGYVIT